MSILLAVLFFLQSQYIHQLVQSRMFVEEDPLVDLYKCLRILYSTKVIMVQKTWRMQFTEQWSLPVSADAFPGFFCHWLQCSLQKKTIFLFVLTLHCMVLNTYADSFCLSLQLQVLHFQVSLEFTCMFVLLSLSKHLINRPLLVIIILYTALYV